MRINLCIDSHLHYLLSFTLFWMDMKIHDSKKSEVVNLQKYIQLDFPNDYNDLVRLCLNNVGFPVCYYHVEILCDCLTVKLSNDTIEKLRIPYVYLSAYYFLLDSLVDGHLVKKDDSLYVTHLLAAATYRFSQLIFINYPEKSQSYIDLFRKMVSANAEAIRQENYFKSKPLEPSENEELENIVGRANSCIFLLELIGVIADRTIENNLREVLHNFLFYMQLGDDLGDWREDFEQNHWTSFLRLCFSKLDKTPSKIDELESFIYGTGIYEERAIKVLKGFDDIINKINSNYPKLTNFVEQQRNRLYYVLNDFIETKTPYINEK